MEHPKLNTKTEQAFRWEARESVSTGQRLFFISVILLVVSVIAWFITYKHYSIAQSISISMPLAVAFWQSVARLFGLWPNNVGNFVYFRHGRILYRTGINRFAVAQGDISLDDISKIVLTGSKIELWLQSRRIVWRRLDFPPTVWFQCTELINSLPIFRPSIEVRKLVKTAR